MSTLSYATRAKNIQNRPVVQYDPKEQQIASLRREIDLLRQENAYLREQLQAGGVVPVTPWAGAPRGGLGAADDGEEGVEVAKGGGSTNWPSLQNYPSMLVSSHGRPQGEATLQQQQQLIQLQQQQQHLQQQQQAMLTSAAAAGVPANPSAGPTLLQSTESPRNSFTAAAPASGSTWSILDPQQQQQQQYDSYAGGAPPATHMRSGYSSQAAGGAGPPGHPPMGLPPPSPGLRSSMAASQQQQNVIWDDASYPPGAIREEPNPNVPRPGPVTINELEMQRRLKETQALLSQFSQENNRLAKENDKLVRTRTVSGPYWE